MHIYCMQNGSVWILDLPVRRYASEVLAVGGHSREYVFYVFPGFQEKHVFKLTVKNVKTR